MSNKKLAKRDRSNALRLAALQEKSRSQQPALKIPAEASTCPRVSHHTVFTDSTSGGGKVTLFDDSASDEETVLEERFHGPGGEKLLQLQRRIGVDQRFRLDSTFLDEALTEKEVVKEKSEDEHSRSLAVLDAMFGPSTVSTTTTRTDIVIPPRYDPLSITPTLHEQPMEAVKNEETMSDDEDEVVGNSPNRPPDVTDDTYYAINTDLRGLFAADDEGSKFSFLPPESDDEIECVEEDKMSTVSTDQRPIRVENETMEARQEERMFFHHSEGVVDHMFYRTEVLHCLEAGWTERRAALKHSFRKRHRDATKTLTKVRKHK